MRRLRIPDDPGALDALLAVAPMGVHEVDGELIAHGPAFSDGEPVPATASERLAELARPAAVEGQVLVRADWMAPAPPGMAEIVLTGGAGFGTGAHATTRDCLALLLDLEPRGSFADLGCGSGVLSIAAAQRGFAPVTAFDVSADAVATARANAALNGVAVEVCEADLLLTAPPVADVIAANVPGELHLAIAAGLATMPRAVIVSCLAGDHADAVAAYAQQGLRVTRSLTTVGWVSALLEPGPAAGPFGGTSEGPCEKAAPSSPADADQRGAPATDADQRGAPGTDAAGHADASFGEVEPAHDVDALPYLGARLAEHGARVALMELPFGARLDVWALGDGLRWGVSAPPASHLDVLEEALLTAGPPSEVLLRLALTGPGGERAQITLALGIAHAEELGLFVIAARGAVAP